MEVNSLLTHEWGSHDGGVCQNEVHREDTLVGAVRAARKLRSTFQEPREALTGEHVHTGPLWTATFSPCWGLTHINVLGYFGAEDGNGALWACIQCFRQTAK